MLFVVELLHSRVYDILRVSNQQSTRVIGPISSDYVPFRSEVECLTTAFRIPIVEVARFVSPTYFEAPMSSICVKYIAKRKEDKKDCARKKSLVYGEFRTTV